MINGNEFLKVMYPSFSDEQRTPNGIDLCLGKVYELDDAVDPAHDWFSSYGLFKEELSDGTPEKDLPPRVEVHSKFLDCYHIEGWNLLPNKVYILEVDEAIRIIEDSVQLYFPRSSLLRGGVSLFTAVGDCGFHGKLQFMCVNHGHLPFFLEKGVRFAQLVDFGVDGVSKLYDGDYQEEDDDFGVGGKSGDINSFDDVDWTGNRIEF